jgi:hypothetical protein
VPSASLTVSPWSWLQLQVGGSSTGATAQAQVSPFSTPLRLNPSLILTGGVSSGQRANSTELTPNLSATLVGELLLGGPTERPGYSVAFNGGFLYAPWAAGLLSNAAGGSAGLSFTAFRGYYHDAPAADADDRRPVAPTGTPRLAFGAAAGYSQMSGALQSDPAATGVMRTLGLDFFVTYTSPLVYIGGEPSRFFFTVTPGVRGMINSTSTGPDTGGAGVSGTLTVGLVTGERPSHHR